ncbi:MAG: sugar transferase, partial [Lachnospiraceae bacterium]|nr:sugar transferase [Lachnospiraceae bacterium]
MYKRTKQGWLKHLDFIIWDAISLQLAFILAYIIRLGLSLPYFKPAYRQLAIAYLLCDFVVAAVFNTMHNVLK